MFSFFRRKKNTDQTASTDASVATSTTEMKQTAPQEASAEPVLEASQPIPTPEQQQSWFSRLKNSLGRTRKGFVEGLSSLFLGKKEIDADLLDELETLLLSADVGVETTRTIIDQLTMSISRQQIKDPQAVFARLQELLVDILKPCEAMLTIPENTKPFVILMIGVNGAGKTTTIGKLAKHFQQAQLSVMLAAGDTFRAAAIEQLQVWGERNHVPVMAQHTGADSASVIFDALQSAKAKGIDVLLADTAGRLHTRENLMDELKKVKRVMSKLDSEAPHEVLLVLDSGMGQNALMQAIKFHEALGVTGLVLTKLDGTAKGGIIFAIANQLKLPIRYIGVGEKLDDLRPFHAQEYVNALFS